MKSLKREESKRKRVSQQQLLLCHQLRTFFIMVSIKISLLYITSSQEEICHSPDNLGTIQNFQQNKILILLNPYILDTKENNSLIKSLHGTVMLITTIIKTESEREDYQCFNYGYEYLLYTPNCPIYTLHFNYFVYILSEKMDKKWDQAYT